MPHPVPIRLAMKSDAVPIAQMSRDLIEHGLGWSWAPPRVRQSMADPQTNVIVVPAAVTGSAPDAFAIMRYRDDDAHLLLLAVQPARWRQGVGTALMDWLEKVAVTAGLERISLEARQSNDQARAFYRRLGYVESHLRAGYYSGREASVQLSKDLRLDRAQRA